MIGKVIAGKKLSAAEKKKLTRGVLITGAGIGGTILLLNYMQNRKRKSDLKLARQSSISYNGNQTGGPSVNLYDQAGLIAYELGTDTGTLEKTWNWSSWGEDEDEAAMYVLQVPKQYIPQLEDIYLRRFDRNLRNDLQTLLDERWNDVKYLFI